VLTQDEDVLDTWFSSALWPFSTLGWPTETAELRRYYPGDVLVTGFDIIFFWVARMMMMGIHFMGEVPFHTVYIHGLVRDEKNQKMSKSKGNIVDPLELIEGFGADALRFTIASLAGPGRDIKLGPRRVESQRSFVTKLWNAARFCEMNKVAPDAAFSPADATLPLTRWILAEASRAVVQATAALEAYRLDEYAAAIHRFTWHSFCDWFLELAKPVLYKEASADAAEVGRTAAHVLGIILRLLHPVMPFVTEELWDTFGFGADCSLIRAEWPQPFPVEDDAAARAEMEWVTRLIGEVRTVRAEMNVPPSRAVPVLLKDAAPESLERGARWMEAIARMARASEFRALEGDVPGSAAQALMAEATMVIPLEGVIDVTAERARLQKERSKAAREAEAVARKLDNAEFVRKAPEEVVEENRERLLAAQNDIARLEVALKRIA
jgi:valyl-tRNA synthetase